MIPRLINGESFEDNRGVLKFNNKFIADKVKRLYVIKNANHQLIRGWQGHKIEQRWFMSIKGTFKIQIVKINNWKNPEKLKNVDIYQLDNLTMNILHIPKGYITTIQSLTKDAELLVMADYELNEIEDEFRYPLNYFKLKN